MNTEVSAEIQAEIEVLELLRRSCRTLRSNRHRPILAGPASRWEVKLTERLDELIKNQTPPLPLKTAKAAA